MTHVQIFDTTLRDGLKAPGTILTAGGRVRVAKQLAKAKDPTEAARLRERLTRGFYGI